MSDKNVEKAPEQSNAKEFTSFLQEVKDFALTVDEDCPEGHRRDPGSGRCLPMGSTDHTAFTRSVNVDYGPEWRGDETKPEDTVFANQETAVDASDMEDRESCAEGTTFSFVQQKCISLEEAELENADETPMGDEDAAAPGQGGHEEITQMQPEGRRDTVNHECPQNMFFDYVRRECIPLNKDTVMASEAIDDEFKKAFADHLYGRIAVTSPDPLDGHTHLVTVDEEGNGKTSVVKSYMDDKTYYHSHDVAGYMVENYTSDGYTSQHFGHVIPKEIWEYDRSSDSDESSPVPAATRSEEAEKEDGAKITTKQRKALPSSSFGVPGKRKFPLDTCGRVRNAMARFNQAKGLTSSEKATLRRKILARAKSCGIEVRNFAKATTDAEFIEVLNDLLGVLKEDRLARYSTDDAAGNGPCPPGMEWDKSAKKCAKMRGFVDSLRNAQHQDIVKHQPEGRRDPVGFQCPDGWFFDFTNRRCLPLDPSQKPGTTTTKAEEEDAQRDLSPSPKGKPAKLPQDCPPGTMWNGERKTCTPLDSRKKTKSADDEDAQTTSNGPGKDKDSKGCGPGEFLNPVTKKCMPRKGAFKGKSEREDAVNAQPGNREGLTAPPAGKAQHPTDCPPNTAWDAKNKICRPIDSMDKSRPDGPSPQPATDTASVENLSSAQLIQQLDAILKERGEKKEKARVAAKDLPNAAFPPSLVGETKRSLMHHTTAVEDPYDHETVDVGRLRNALARTNKVAGFSDKAIEDAREHLLYHARALVAQHLSKKD